MAADNNRPSELDVVQLIGKDNAVNLTVEDVSVVEPTFTDENERNTTAVVQAQPAYAYSGQVQVFYDRWDLSKLFSATQLFVGVLDSEDPSELVGAINFEYGTQLPVDELDVAKVEDNVFTITAKSTSTAYIGSIEVLTSNTRMPLNGRLTFTDLNGFRYPGNRNPGAPGYKYNADLSWANAPDDNGKGYDVGYNKYLKISARTYWNAHGASADDRREGNFERLPQLRKVYGWGLGDSLPLEKNQPWTCQLAFHMDGMTYAELIELYSFSMKVSSRPDDQSPWVSNQGGLFTLALVNGVPWWHIDGEAVVRAEITVGEDGWFTLEPLTSVEWFYPGLTLGGAENQFLVGQTDMTITAVRKDGLCASIELPFGFDAVALPNVREPQYTLL